MAKDRQQGLVPVSEIKPPRGKSLGLITSEQHDVLIQPDGRVIPYNFREVQTYVIRISNPRVPFGLGDEIKDIPLHHQKWAQRIAFWAEIKEGKSCIIPALVLVTAAGCAASAAFLELAKH